jgi:uncharacterized phage protein gp47/JayE
MPSPFVSPDLLTLERRIADDYRTKLGTPAVLLPHSPEAALASIDAATAHGLYRHLERVAGTALWAVLYTDTYLDLWATRFGVPRKNGGRATGFVEANGTEGTTIPEGTLWQRTADAFEYRVTEDTQLLDVATNVPVEAVTSGVAGNALSGSPVTLAADIAGVVNGGEIAGAIKNGTAPETNDQLLARLLQRLRFPPKGGGHGDYVRWALEVAGVTRAWEFETNGLVAELGYITVRFVVDGTYDADPTFPDTTSQLEAMKAHIEETMPVGLELVVPAADTTDYPNPGEYGAQALNPTIKIKPNTDAVRSAAARALRVAISRGRMGAVFPVSLLYNALTNEALVQDFEIVTPVANIAVGELKVLILGTTVWETLP